MSIFQQALDYLRWGGDPEADPDDDYAADEFDDTGELHEVGHRRESGVHHLRDERTRPPPWRMRSSAAARWS